jgi:hypothetical protein
MGEALAFPGLRGWVIHFKDTQPVTQCAAIGIGVQPGAKHYKLTHTAFHSGRQSILREARPGSDKNSHPQPGGLHLSLADCGFALVTQDAEREGVGEDATLFQDLMSGSVSGCGPGRVAWLCAYHPVIIPLVPGSPGYCRSLR